MRRSSRAQLMQAPQPAAAQQTHPRQLQQPGSGSRLDSTSDSDDRAKSRTAWPEKVKSLGAQCAAVLVVEPSCLGGRPAGQCGRDGD